MKPSVEIERENVVVEFDGPFRLDQFDRALSKDSGFGLYFLVDEEVPLDEFKPISKSVVYIGRAPYVGLRNRLRDHFSAMSSSNAHVTDAWGRLRARIGCDPSRLWFFVGKVTPSAIEDVIYSEVAFLQNYMKAELHHGQDKQLPEANKSDS